VTYVASPIKAGLTDTTRDHRVDTHPSTYQIVGRAETDLNDFTGELVSEYQGWDHPGVMPLKRRKVGTTDTHGLGPNDDLVALGRRIGHARLCHLPDPDKLGGLHERALLNANTWKDMNWTS
jgi:hypothetical protein